MVQKKRQKLKENLLGYGFLSPALILLLIFLVIPVGMVVYYAFTDYYLLTPNERKFIGLANFARLLKDPTFLKSVLNTAQFVIWIIPVQLGAALGMALIVNKKRKGNMFFKVAFFAPVVMSLVVISILWLYLLNPNNGLLNALLNKIGIASQPFLRSPNRLCMLSCLSLLGKVQVIKCYSFLVECKTFLKMSMKPQNWMVLLSGNNFAISPCHS